MGKIWVVIASSAHAHCYERHGPGHSLTKLKEFVHQPTRLADEKGRGDLTGAAGKGHGRTAHAGTQFEPHTEAHAKERGIFSRQIAEFINEEVAANRCTALALIATGPMLGEIKSHLSEASTKLVHRNVDTDLTAYAGAELQRRVDEVLRAFV